jgi:hypothetical protein
MLSRGLIYNNTIGGSNEVNFIYIYDYIYFYGNITCKGIWTCCFFWFFLVFPGFFWFFAVLIIGFGVYKFAKFINGGKNVTSFDYFVALMSFVIMVWLFGFAVS